MELFWTCFCQSALVSVSAAHLAQNVGFEQLGHLEAKAAGIGLESKQPDLHRAEIDLAIPVVTKQTL